jgi:sirohydrochlorin ferrochelatase
LADPAIPVAVQRLMEQGIARLTVAPLLLFAAGHAKRDIPAAVQEAVGGRRCAVGGGQKAVGGRQHAECSSQRKAEIGGRKSEDEAELIIEQCGALECHERIVELSAQRFNEAIAGRAAVEPAETLLILVARGSSEAAAIEKMHQFAALRAQRSPVARVECCFAAVATPTLNEALDRAAATPMRRIVVQPHLLFAGQVLDQIAGAVAEVAKRQPKQEWIVAPHLGPSPLVAEAVLDLARREGRSGH